MQRKKWERPILTLLIRSEYASERSLATCKTAGSSTNPGGSVGGVCQAPVGGGPSCPLCFDIAIS